MSFFDQDLHSRLFYGRRNSYYYKKLLRYNQKNKF